MMVSGRSQPTAVNKNLDSLSLEDWVLIGKSFAAFVDDKTDSKSAIVGFIDLYPALKEFDGSFAWFRPMLETVAQNLNKELSSETKARLYFGAGLGALNMATDVFTMVLFLNETETAKRAFGKSLLCVLGICFWFKFYFNLQQNKTASPRIQVRETLYVACCVKAGVDANRVAKGLARDCHQLVDPQMEQGKFLFSTLFYRSLTN
jgi:hypothetical protein